MTAAMLARVADLAPNPQQNVSDAGIMLAGTNTTNSTGILALFQNSSTATKYIVLIVILAVLGVGGWLIIKKLK